MPCLHPMERWEIATPGQYTVAKTTGEAKESIAKVRVYGADTVNGISRTDPRAQIQIIPCNRCLGCKMDKAKQMAERITLEAQLYPNRCWFLTLTYDDDHVPLVGTTDGSDAVVAMTLRKEDSVAFCKALRQYWQQHYDHAGIRFFAAGEYGSKTHRPHMHMCLLNLPLEHILPVGNNNRGDPLFTQQELERIWGKGQITIAPLTPESAAYTARYCIKKIDPADTLPGQEAEFTLMSRRPGLGAPYYEQHKEDIYSTDQIALLHGKNVQKTVPPKYFDRLYKQQNWKKLEKLKATRARKLVVQEAMRQQTDKRDYLSYLRSKEMQLKQKADRLRREL